MTDIISLIIRVVILYFLIVISHEAMRKRMWAFVILALGLYLNIFRLTILRAMTIYLGVFNYNHKDLIDGYRQALMSSPFGLLADIPFLIGTFAIFLYVVTQKKPPLKNEKG